MFFGPVQLVQKSSAKTKLSHFFRPVFASGLVGAGCGLGLWLVFVLGALRCSFRVRAYLGGNRQ